ncbi:hypothetical protein PMIN03_007057 [Paraphaeosphaeria minitans]
MIGPAAPRPAQEKHNTYTYKLAPIHPHKPRMRNQLTANPPLPCRRNFPQENKIAAGKENPKGRETKRHSHAQTQADALNLTHHPENHKSRKENLSSQNAGAEVN